MAKNLIPEAVKLLGLEIGEEFNFCGYRKNCMIDEDGNVLEATDNGEWKRSEFTTLADLFRVSHEIRKLPWKPKTDENYYTFEGVLYSDSATTTTIWSVEDYKWYNGPNEVALFDKGWVYRTREEAEAALPKVAEELGVKYEV